GTSGSVFDSESVTPAVGETITFHASSLPGNLYAIAQDSTNGPLGNHFVRAFDGSTLQWRFPASGTAPGSLVRSSSFDVNQPVYGIGTYPAGPTTLEFIEQIDGSSHLLNWRNFHAPADALIPTADGFFSVFQDPGSTNFYLEHGDASGAYLYGKQYPNSAAMSPGFYTF